MSKTIPYGRQSISQADIDAVVDVLKSDWLTQGPEIAKFERLVNEYCGASYSVAVCNATAALHIACLALDLGPGDRLWTSPNTFVASANCGLYCGATVDFVDIDPRTYNLSVDSLRRKLKSARERGLLPKVLVAVHFAGQSCEMKEIRELSKRYGFKIIEDASHAIGGSYLGGKVGACAYSDLTVFSFHPVKIITTGEGGMITTQSPDLHRKLQLLRSHGITRDESLMSQPSHGGWYYEQITLGFNYRITDIQAVLGASQLASIDHFVARRREIFARYNKALAGLPLSLPWQHPDTDSAHHLYVIQLRLEALRKSHRQVFDELRAKGIGANLHYIPVHLQPYYRALGFSEGDFPQAEAYYTKAISLPMYSALTDEDQSRVIIALREILS